MGNCLSSNGGDGGKDGTKQAAAAKATTKRMPKGRPDDDKMAATWKKTGIIGLRDRGLKELPPQVEGVGADAKVLDATNNKLTAFPLALQELTQLQRATLGSNSIADVNGSVLLSLASTLKILVLDSNLISRLPDEIGSLVRLEKLSLKNNQLSELNQNVGNLKTLQFLTLSNNKLRALPGSVSDCSVLEELDASDNQIASIPEELGKLEKMKTLNLDRNKVSQVPSSVFLQCAALQTLSLHGNPITPDVVHETDGFQEFEKRRQEKYTKGLLGGVVFGANGLDEGIDRQLKRPTRQ